MFREDTLQVKDLPPWAENFVFDLMGEFSVLDHETFLHCTRVSSRAYLFARALKLSESEVFNYLYAGLFHDVGKMKIDHKILHKPGKLSNDEYGLIKTHSTISAEMIEPLEKLEGYSQIKKGVLYHHERIDGHGYPSGLADIDIPQIARAILIVDTFDAMTTDRAYRKGLPVKVAYAELKKLSGQQFDKDLVKVFLDTHSEWESQRHCVELRFLKYSRKIKVS